MATLHVTDGPAAGQRYALGQHNLLMIGRDASCTFQIVDPELSRTHMHVRYVAGENQHYATDCESKNGVWIQGVKIECDTALSDGHIIRIGDTTLLYSIDDTLDAIGVSEMAKRYGEARDQTRTSD